MHEQERIARDLAASLGAIECEAVGGGLHWQVHARRGARTCKVNCFWYEAHVHALMIGMNPANTREAMRAPIKPYDGPEYQVYFLEGEHRVADGRSREKAAAVASIAAWTSGVSLDELERRWPYVAEVQRRLRAVVAVVEPRCRDVARCELQAFDGGDLLVRGEARECRVRARGDAISVSFLLGPAQVAFASATDDVSGVVERWMRGATLEQMVGVQVERHARLLEAGDPTGWHLAHTRERIEDDGDVLVALRPLLRRLAQSDIATQFYSYSSLNRFCFSASSHFPWVDAGLPIISPRGPNRGYFVEIGGAATECTLDAAVALVEATLRAYPVRPFFGAGTRASSSGS